MSQSTASYHHLVERTYRNVSQNGLGQALAWLKSSASPEGEQLYTELNTMLCDSASIKDQDILESLCKRDSAFSAQLSLTAREYLSTKRSAN